MMHLFGDVSQVNLKNQIEVQPVYNSQSLELNIWGN